MTVLGEMSMPAHFRYAAVLRRGMPQHTKSDSFRLDHPSMPPAQWAKIFSPFDALKGFSEAVAAKEVLYEFRRDLSADEEEELNRRLGILQLLTPNTRAAREHRIEVTAEYYVPCLDPDHFSYGYRGQYRRVTGILWSVDAASTHTILIGDMRISFSDMNFV